MPFRFLFFPFSLFQITISDDATAIKTKTIDLTDSSNDLPVYEIINKPFKRSETETLSNYPDIEIIRRDENTVDKSIPHDIPADIELIPMSADDTLLGKRAPKRAFTPDNAVSKVTRFNESCLDASRSRESRIRISGK